MTQELEVLQAIPTQISLSPKKMIELAQEQAKVLCDMIEQQRLYSTIRGKKYVRVEGWVPLARMNGVIPREVSNEARPDGSYVARVQLVKIEDGTILTEASAECGGEDEPTWQERPPYARRSMAATRATGKACRLAYSWIVALAGFEPTPAEEMPADHGESPPEYFTSERGNTFRQGPNSYYSFNRDDGSAVIGAYEGDKYTAAFLTKLGFQRGVNRKDVWYLEYDEDVVKILKEAVL